MDFRNFSALPALVLALLKGKSYQKIQKEKLVSLEKSDKLKKLQDGVLRKKELEEKENLSED